jgi:hypothetical protein
MQAQRKQMIMAQQEKGVLGAMRGLNKLSQDKDLSRISKDQMEESKIFTTGKP